MGKLSIRTRLLASFGVLLVLMVIGDWRGISSMREMHDTTTNIVEKRLQRVQMAQQGVALVNENSRRALELFVVREGAREVPKDSRFAKILEDQRATSLEITKLYSAFEDGLDNAEERRLFAGIKEARQDYVTARSKAEKKLEEGNVADSKADMQQLVMPKLGVYLARWRELAELESRMANDAAKQATDEYGYTKQLLIALMAAAAIGALLIAMATTRAITKPLRALTTGARRLATGDSVEKVDVPADPDFGALAAAFNGMADAVVNREQYLRGEMGLAQRLQISLLPRRASVPGFDIAGQMVPASEVGGDYYDVLPTEKGFWLGIGDVSGHGLNSGLIMMMVQTAVAALVSHEPLASPAKLIAAVNQVLYDNIRHRLSRNEYVTLTLLRFDADGKVVFAGAHVDLLVIRADGGRPEWIPTPGTWLGFARDISRQTKESSFQLHHGDLLVLHTDGVVEARSENGAMYGTERLTRTIQGMRADDLQTMSDQIVDDVLMFAAQKDDDITVVLARYAEPQPAQRISEQKVRAAVS